jgi:hypothetical protein
VDDQTGSVNQRLGSDTAEMDPDTERRARTIRSEIAQTRGALSETVDAIQDRLRPSTIVSNAKAATTEKAKDMAQQAATTAEEWWDASGGSRLVDRIRAHPVPAALTGLGLAWLLFANGRRSSSLPLGQSQWRRGSAMEPSPRTFQPGVGEDDRPSALARSRGVASQGRRRLETTMREYPLAIGAAAMIVGVAVGMAVPETEREKELIGEARDQAISHARDMATETASRVKTATVDAISRSVVSE